MTVFHQISVSKLSLDQVPDFGAALLSVFALGNRPEEGFENNTFRFGVIGSQGEGKTTVTNSLVAADPNFKKIFATAWKEQFLGYSPLMGLICRADLGGLKYDEVESCDLWQDIIPDYRIRQEYNNVSRAHRLDILEHGNYADKSCHAYLSVRQAEEGQKIFSFRAVEKIAKSDGCNDFLRSVSKYNR